LQRWRLDSLAVNRFATDDHTHHAGTCDIYIQLCELHVGSQLRVSFH